MSALLETLVILALIGQTDYKAELQKEAVVIKDGKMIVEGFGIVKGRDPDGDQTSMQVKFHSEAPAQGVIHRDNFLLVTGMIYLPIFMQFGPMERNVP